MSKVKISELAKELGKTWKELANEIENIIGRRIKSPHTKLDEEQVALIKEIIPSQPIQKKEEKETKKAKSKEKRYRVFDLYHEWKVSFEEFKEALKSVGYSGEVSTLTEINEETKENVKSVLKEIIENRKREEEEKRKREEEERKRREEEERRKREEAERKKREEEERRKREEEERKRKEEEEKRRKEEEEKKKREKEKKKIEEERKKLEEKKKLEKGEEKRYKKDTRREEFKKELRKERKEKFRREKSTKDRKDYKDKKFEDKRDKRFKKERKGKFEKKDKLEREKREAKSKQKKSKEEIKSYEQENLKLNENIEKLESVKETKEGFSLQAEIQKQKEIQQGKVEDREKEKQISAEIERRKESKEEKAEMEALRKLLGETGKKKKKRKRKKEEKEKKQKEVIEEEEDKIVIIPEMITVRELAEKLNVPATQILMDLMKRKILATVNQNIDPEVALQIAEDYGYLAEIEREGEEVSIVEELSEEEKKKLLGKSEENEEDYIERPPVVTVMGHVDHGKTTLLDRIRKTDVAAKEAGGITQHIGAYKIKLSNGKEITFLDTPGHEAFTTLRARGSKVADIAVLVVAADDGVKPQTIEAINHAKNADVPILVAINKIDKPGADPERVKRELSQFNLIPEEWGGDIIMVPVSAKTGKNIDELLENILLVSEILELKANPKQNGIGTVIEAKLDPKRGPVATVLIENGTVKNGDYFVAGYTWGKVRAMYDDKGNLVKEATPGTPVEILGFNEVPRSGDKFIVKGTEREARQLAEQRKQKLEEELLAKRMRLNLENLKDTKEVNIILKADVQGSLEAILKSIDELSEKIENVKINVIHNGIGAITESDVMLAAASNGIVIGFNVRPDATARKAAEEEGIQIKIYSIIYELIEDLEKALKGMLEPKKREELLGIAEVKRIFRIKGVGTVAGCIVIEGMVKRNSKARLVRDGVVIYDGEIASLKRFKDDVKEVAKGYECGIMLKDFNDIKPSDQIESYQIVEEKQE